MSTKRFYIPLVIVLFLSVLLFGVSYSKESGNSPYIKDAIEKDGLKIIYSNGNFINVENSTKLKDYKKVHSNIVSVTNEEKKDKDYQIKIYCQDCYNKNIYYSLDNEPAKLLTEETIYKNTLSSYGKENDHKIHDLKVFSTEKYNEDVKYEVKIYNNAEITSNNNDSSEVTYES